MDDLRVIERNVKGESTDAIKTLARNVKSTLNTRDMFNRLSKLQDCAERAMLVKKVEVAYFYLQRWLHIVDLIKATKEYKKDEAFYTKVITNDEINKISRKSSDLQKVIEKKTQKSVPNEIKISSSVKTKENDSLTLPETPKEEPSNSESEDVIKCVQLYKLIQENPCKCLIIDIRPKHEYELSKILSDNCINIPGKEIENGKAGPYFEKYLSSSNKKSYELFKSRATKNIELIVILDGNTTSEKLVPNNKVFTLKEILRRWDLKVKQKKILCLDGGFANWSNHYPNAVTNPCVELPNLEDSHLGEILDTIEYPDFDEKPVKPPTISTVPPRTLKPTAGTKTVINTEVKIPQVSKNMNIVFNNVSNNYKYNVDNNVISYENKIEANDSRDFKSNGQSSLKNKPRKSILSSIPTVDRSNKPSLMKPQYDIEKKIISALCEEFRNAFTEWEELLQAILQLNQKLLEYEKDSSEYRSIQEKLDLLQLQLQKKNREYEIVKQKFEQYVQRNKEEAIQQDIMILDRSITAKEIKLKILEADIERKKPNYIQKESKLVEKQTDGEIRKEPVKFGGATNTGLKRSYSSPNIAQLDDRKIPQVDRSSKPTIRGKAVGTESNIIRHSTRSWRDRELRMAPVYQDVYPGITGLKNLGNSCYMNSIIQCLSNTDALAKYFNDNLYLEDLNTNNENGHQGSVAEEVAQVIQALWRGQYRSISPRDLKVAIGQYKLQFESHEQQDSHEFLTFLLDWMHNDLKKNVKEISRPLSASEKEWYKAMECQISIISQLFFGQLRSSINCSVCGNSSTTYETFNCLTMSLPHSNKCTLNDCMKKFVNVQKVSGWKCPNCKVAREATKKFDFVKLAPIIVLHLNRFGESDGWLEKKNTAVDFPLTGFNLRQYVISDNDTHNSAGNNHYNYDLYAMSNHYGTMEGGHYTAFCRNATQNKWYKYDDHTVSEVSPNQVKSQATSAYLLFYMSSPIVSYGTT